MFVKDKIVTRSDSHGYKKLMWLVIIFKKLPMYTLYTQKKTCPGTRIFFFNNHSMYLDSVQKKKRKFSCCFISGIKRCTALYFNMTMPDPEQQATPQFLTNNNVQHSPWPSTSPDLNPNKNTLGTSWRDVFEWGRVNAMQMCASCFWYSSRSGWPSQLCKWCTTWSHPSCRRDAEQLFIIAEDTPLTDMHVTQLQNGREEC